MKSFPETIAKLERATEGSRELDVQIAYAINADVGLAGEIGMPFRKWFDIVGLEKATHEAEMRPNVYKRGLDRYTTSIDAALALVPGGLQWIVRTDLTLGAFAHVTRDKSTDDDFSVGKAYAATPALALCIAALKSCAAPMPITEIDTAGTARPAPAIGITRPLLRPDKV